MRKVIYIFVALILASVCGCSKKRAASVADVDQETKLLATADSLIDIVPDSALMLCHHFFKEHESKLDSLYARAKAIEGNAYFSMGDLDEAISALAEARDVSARCGDKYTLINATADLGVMMRVSDKPDSALTLYNEALALIPAGEYKEEKAHLLTSIAVLYANTGLLDEARHYADMAVAAATDCGDMDMMMYASSQAGAIYNLLGNSEKGFELTRMAVANARVQNLPRYELKALGHLIDLHLKAGNRDSVFSYLERGETLAAQFPENSVEGLGFLEEKYVVLASMGFYRESLQIQKRLMRLRSEAPTFMPSEKLWLRMARNYKGLSLTDSASYCYERAFEVADSLRGEEIDRQLSEFYVRFKTTEKELALSEMERRKARSDMWLAISIGVALTFCALLAIGVLYVRSRRRQEKTRQLRSYLNGIEEERGRLAKDLHDGICNDLYGIEMMLQTDIDHESLLANVEKIRSDVRRISHEMMPPAINNIGIAEAIEGMAVKWRQSYPAVRFDYSYSPADDWDGIPNLLSYNLYRICQELTGNILRHARPTNVEINLARNEAEIHMTIRNDGGAAALSSKDVGIGLASVAQRLAAIGAKATGLPFSREISILCTLKSAQ